MRIVGYIALLCAAAALLCELVHRWREASTYTRLGQPLLGQERVRKNLSLITFTTLSILLAGGLFLSLPSQYWVEPREGASLIVVPDSSSPVLQGTAKEVVRALKGVPCSLSTISGTKLHPVVPMTIDSLYLSLQIEGLDELGRSDLTVGEMARIAPHEEGRKTWLIILSTQKRPQGKIPSSTIVSTIVPGPEAVVITTYTGGGERRVGSIDRLAEEVKGSLSVPGGGASLYGVWFLRITLLLSLCLFIYFRRLTPPLYIGLILLISPLFSAAPEEINHGVEVAEQLASSKEYGLAKEQLIHLLEIAPTKASPVIMYDLALLAYAHSSFEEALSWLMGIPESAAIKGGVELRGTILCHLNRREELASWYKQKPTISPGLQYRIERLLAVPPRNGIEESLLSLLWLDEEGGSVDRAVPVMRRALSLIEKEVENTHSKELLSLFEQEKKAVEAKTASPRTVGLYAALSLLSFHPERSVDRLLAELLSLTQNGAYWGGRREEIRSATQLLMAFLPVLQEERRAVLTSFLKEPKGSSPSAWFTRMIIWGAFGREKDSIEPIARQLIAHRGDHVDDPTQGMVVQAIEQRYPKLHPKRTTFSSLYERLFELWYESDGPTAICALIDATLQEPELWSSQYLDLLSYALSSHRPLTQRALLRAALERPEELDFFLFGRLVEVLSGSQEQLTAEYFDHLIRLFEMVKLRLQQEQLPASPNLALVQRIQAVLYQELVSKKSFPHDQKRETEYEEWLGIWNESSVALFGLLGQPSSNRPAVVEKVDRAIGALVKLRSLFTAEMEPTVKAEAPVGEVEALAVDPVRLFLELDRSDRQLYERSAQ